MAQVITDLLPQLRIELPGIPEPVLVDGLHAALDDFLKQSEVWKFSVATILNWTTALSFPALGAATEIPASTRVVRIDTVKYGVGGTNLKPVPFKTRDQLDSELPDWEVRTGSSPDVWTNNGPGVPQIVPIADADVLGSLQIRVILSALDQSVTVPTFIIAEFADEIRYGTLARLMKIPGKDWTSLSAASSYKALFNVGVKKAKSRSEAEYGQPVSREMAYGGI